MFGINHALKQCYWFIVHCQKWPCLKWTHSSSALFEWVKCFDVIVDFKSNMEIANTYVVLWSSMHSIGIFKFPPWYKTMYIIIQTHNYINTNLVKPYRLCNVLAWAVRQKISHLWGAVINTRHHRPKSIKFTCYTHAQICNTENFIATIAIQLHKVD